MSGLSLTASENVSDVKNRLAPEHPGSRRMSDYRSFFIELTYRLHLAACLGCPGKPEAGRATARPPLLNSTGISGNRYGIN